MYWVLYIMLDLSLVLSIQWLVKSISEKKSENFTKRKKILVTRQKKPPKTLNQRFHFLKFIKIGFSKK